MPDAVISPTDEDFEPLVGVSLDGRAGDEAAAEVDERPQGVRGEGFGSVRSELRRRVNPGPPRGRVRSAET